MSSLTQWTESRFNAIYEPGPPSETIKALDNFLSKDVTITVNGQPSSRDDVLKSLGHEKGLEAGFELTFDNTVEVPTNKSKPAEVIDLPLSFKSGVDWRIYHGDCLLGWSSRGFLYRHHPS